MAPFFPDTVYIRVMSKQLEREMSGCQLVAPCNTTAFNVVDSIYKCDSWNSDGAISGVTVFTDGSVVNVQLVTVLVQQFCFQQWMVMKRL